MNIVLCLPWLDFCEIVAVAQVSRSWKSSVVASRRLSQGMFPAVLQVFARGAQQSPACNAAEPAVYRLALHDLFASFSLQRLLVELGPAAIWRSFVSKGDGVIYYFQCFADVIDETPASASLRCCMKLLSAFRPCKNAVAHFKFRRRTAPPVEPPQMLHDIAKFLALFREYRMHRQAPANGPGYPWRECSIPERYNKLHSECERLLNAWRVRDAVSAILDNSV